MKLLPGEKEIKSADNDMLTLTTHRLWYEWDAGSEKEIQVILLEDLRSCSLAHHENRVWLGLTALSVVGGVVVTFVNRGGPSIVVGVILGVVFWLLYKFSKRQFLELSSAAERIAVRLRADDLSMGRDFVDSVLAAKNDRYLMRAMKSQSAVSGE